MNATTSENNKHFSYSVLGLSFDGGGMKVLDEVIILAEIDQRLKTKHSLSLHQLIDRIAGTSAGSQIACLIAHPTRQFSFLDIVQFFCELASKVFSVPLWRRALSGNFSSKYRIEQLADTLKTLLGNDFTLQDALYPLTIPTIDGNTGEELFLKSDNKFRRWPLWAAATASSAAPYYFNGFQFLAPEIEEHEKTSQLRYIKRRLFDGGGAFNNPARILYRDLERYHQATPQNVLLLSFGCSITSTFEPYPDGGVQWISRLFEFGHRPAVNTTTTFLADDLQDRFIRLSIPHSFKIELDETNMKDIKRYIEEAQRWIQTQTSFFDALVDKLARKYK